MCIMTFESKDLEYVADDATPVSTPNVDGCKGLSNASGIIIVLQCKCKMMVSGTNKLALSESRSG